MLPTLNTDSAPGGAAIASMPANVRIMPSRRTVDDRFPNLCFFVEAPGLFFFEVVLTTDRTLFDPANVSDRSQSNFYSSREDAQLLEIDEGRGVYHVPPVVLRSFTQQTPQPTELYFVAVAYATANGEHPSFSHPPQTLPVSAPSVVLSSGFTGSTLSRVLGAAAERLKTVGPQGKINPGPGGLPVIEPARGKPKSRIPENNGNGAQQTPPVYPDEGEDGAYRNGGNGGNGSGGSGNGQIGNGGYANGGNGNDVNSQLTRNRNVGSDVDHPPDTIEYNDGYGEYNELEGLSPGPALGDAGGYGDDDYGIPPSGNTSRRNGNHQSAIPRDSLAPSEESRETPLDSVEGLSHQSLDVPFESPADVSADAGGISIAGPLNAENKRQLIEYIAGLESGQTHYSAMNLDGEFKGRAGREHPYYQRSHAGLSYGIVGFNQDSGDLGRLLSLMHERDPGRFEQIFGGDWQSLLDVTNASGPVSLKSDTGRSTRVQPVAGDDLWEDAWIARFRQAAEHPPFQAAQNQLAAELLLEPVLPFARWLGLYSQRGLAMLYDRAAGMGLDQGLKFVLDSVGPIKTEAQRSAVLNVLLEDQEDATLELFQRQAGVRVSGEWNTETHAAMIGALRARHDQGGDIPIEIPGYDEMLDMLMLASSDHAWSARVALLRSDPQLSDTSFSA